MFGVGPLLTWWRARRELHVENMASRDPRSRMVAEQHRSAQQAHKVADRMGADARERLHEVERIKLELLRRGHKG